MKHIKCDLAIVGGGLSGGLIALALNKLRPDLNMVLIEQEKYFGGNHIWSYFATDIAPENRWLTAPLVTNGWSGHDVVFPEHSRQLPGIYYSIEPGRLDQLIRSNISSRKLITGRAVKAVSPRLVVLEGGQRINARGVIDARGIADIHHLDCGWQKFTGQMVQTTLPHNITRPIIMDARVEQIDGCRFVHVLPFGIDTLFIEDIHYSDRPEHIPAKLRKNIAGYAAANGWEIEHILREENGVLPVIMGGDLDSYWTSGSGRVAKVGTRGGFFQPVTSHSLPDAVRTAIYVAGLSDFDGDKLHLNLRRRAQQHWDDGKFYRSLNKMLFRASAPKERYRIWEHFYTLRADLIARFYAGESNIIDKLKILSGRPPVSIGRAIDAIRATRK